MALWEFTNLNKYNNLRTRIIYHPDGKAFGFNPKGLGSFVAARRFRYQAPQPFFGLITSSVNGQKYITPGWIPVVPETTLNDIYYEAPKVKKEQKEKPKKWTFTSARSGEEYTVKYNAAGNLSCTCWGYIAHKKCKHIKEVEAQQ